jgi:hypothetical protein
VDWQHLNILAATNYLRERIASGVPDPRAKHVYEGLLDVLDPSRIERRAKAVATETVRLKPDTPGERLAAEAPQVARQPAPVPNLKAPPKKAAARKKKTSPPATPARRRPARPARPATPRRR